MKVQKNQNMNKAQQPIKNDGDQKNEVTVVDQKLIKQCKLHVRANRVARECKNPKYCSCCKKSYENERISVFCSLKELSFLGAGVPLYFQFINTTRNILIISGIFSIYMMYQNQMEGTYCSDKNTDVYTDCFKDLYSSFSLVNIKHSSTLIEKYSQIQFLLTIALFIAQQIFFRTMCVLKNEVESQYRSPEDYTAQIFNMPPGYIDRVAFPDREQISQKVVMPQLNQNQYQMNMGLPQSSDSDLDYNNIHKNGYNHNEIIHAIRRQYNDKLTIAEVNIAYDLEEFQKGSIKLKKYILQGQNRRQYCSRSCFVTFSTMNQLDVFLADQKRNTLQRFWARLCILFGGSSKKYLIFRNNFIHAEKAPAPDDVYWENISQGLRHPFKKWFYRTLTLTVNIGLILVALVCLFFVNDYKRRIKKSEDFQELSNNDLALYGLAFLSGTIIFIINMINKYIVNILSNWEYRQTKTHLSISRGNKIFLVQLFNTAVIYVLLYLIKYRDEMWLTGGILQDVMITHAQIAVLTPLSNILFNLFKYLERYICLPYGKRAKKGTPEEKQLIDAVLNKLQGYEFNISQEYANTLFLLFSVSFYGPLMPLLYIVGFIALFLQYWTDKYHVVKRYRIPNTISAAINDELYFILQYMPLIQILSFWFWAYILQFDTKQNYIYYGIVVSSLIIIIPSKFIPRIFCKIMFSTKEQDDMTYNDALMRDQFKKFYDQYNPLTHNESISKYESILQKQKISKAVMKGLNEALRKEEAPINNSQQLKEQSQQYLQQIPKMKQIQQQQSRENITKNTQFDNSMRYQQNNPSQNIFFTNQNLQEISRVSTPKNFNIINKDQSRPTAFQIPLVVQHNTYSENSQEGSGYSKITNPNMNQINEEEFFSSVTERQNIQPNYITNASISGKENLTVARKYSKNINIELNTINNEDTSRFETNHNFKPVIKIQTQSNVNQNRYVIPQQYIQNYNAANQDL